MIFVQFYDVSSPSTFEIVAMIIYLTCVIGMMLIIFWMMCMNRCNEKERKIWIINHEKEEQKEE